MLKIKVYREHYNSIKTSDNSMIASTYSLLNDTVFNGELQVPSITSIPAKSTLPRNITFIAVHRDGSEIEGSSFTRKIGKIYHFSTIEEMVNECGSDKLYPFLPMAKETIELYHKHYSDKDGMLVFCLSNGNLIK